MWKEIVDIGILVTPRNIDRKIMKNNRIDLPQEQRSWTSRASLDDIYQSNTYRKDLSWLHFDDEPKVQEK